MPLLTVFFGILTFFHQFSQFSILIENFIFTHILPANGNVLQPYFHSFIKNAFTLSSISLVFLLIIAVKMIFLIEETFDVIWKIKKKRSFVYAAFIYGSTLILFPVLSGIVLIIISYLAPFFASAGLVFYLKKIILVILPGLLLFLLFFLIYLSLPNTKVKLTAALYGALLTTFLFEIIKNIFQLYIKNFTSYELLYGSLSLIPVFLIWIYFLWVIILLGAVFTYVFQKLELL